MRPGEQLKDLRSRLGITTREVTEKSQRIAEAENNEEFSISNAWLTQIENTQATPSIYKLYSISTIYHIRFSDLLLLFGVNLQKIGAHQLSMPLENTHLTTMEAEDENHTVTFPVRFDRGFSLERTNLLSRMVEVWGEIPIALIRHLDLRRSQYGYIGLNDLTLYPMLRPGSFVQINQKVRKSRVPNGERNLTGPSISSSCATAMRALGANFWAINCSLFPILFLPAASGSSSSEPTPRS